jgi:glyoxalase family protein
VEPLRGLHHVTAITGDAPGNVDFYSRLLGMRLVKKTVNQDDVSAYHLYYADDRGTPGSDLTFFHWPQTPPNVPGVPSIGPVALRVAGERALDWWASTFDRLEVAHEPPGADTGPPSLAFRDPEGQRLVLVADGGTPGGEPWPGSPVPEEFQVRGLYGVTLVSGRPEVTADLLEQLMGFRQTSEQDRPAGRERVFEVGEEGPGAQVRLLLPSRPVLAQQGRGGVHHVAFRVPDESVQLAWRERIASVGLAPTPVIDRFYFQSVYFREPGGNLFEIATDGPGFTADEPLAELGRHLSLPPFLEGRRREIEAALTPLP